MKPRPQRTEKDLGEDSITFEQLPSKTQELLVLQDQAEKSTGKEKLDLEKMTRNKSK